ncbi:MAG: glycoside hydrolase domain-containing protein [Candidatus Brocadiia bacterium]
MPKPIPFLFIVVLSAVVIGEVFGESLNLEAHYYPSYGQIQLELSQNLFKTPDGKPGLRAVYYNNIKTKGKPVTSRVEVFPKLDKRFAHKHVGADNYSISWRGTFGPVPQTGVYELSTVTDDGVRAWVGEKKIISDWRPHPPAPNTGRIRLEKGQTVKFRIDFFEKGGGDTFRAKWGLSKAEGDADDADVLKTAVFELIAEDGKKLHSRKIKYAPGGDKVMVEVGDLPAGRHTVRVAPEGDAEAGETSIMREYFPWEGNRFGITNKIYPPFEPIKIKDDTLQVVMRKYTVGGLGFWQSVQARGNETDYKELLAAPMRLVANGKPLEGEGKFSSTAPHRAIYEGKATGPAVTVESRAISEYDGCMRVELTLRPGAGKEQLQSLSLAIPIKDEMAPLWHLCTMGIRGNPAGRTPEGKGQFWQTRGQYGTMRPHGNRQRRGNWEPYIWLGAEERGLAWFADNDAGWVPDYKNKKPALTMERKEGVLTLRVHLVQKPVVLEEPRTIVFGLMGSPAKPMPENWRNIVLGNMWKYSGSLPGYRKFDWMGSQYWGSNEYFSAKYPVNKDFSVLDKMQEAWLGKPGNFKEYLRIWSDRNLGDAYPGGGHGQEQTRKLVQVSLQWARRVPGDMTVYWEEFVKVTGTHPEMRTFRWEWTGGNGHTPNICRSYRDFACWFGAEFLRRGIGLYFDNTFMEPAFDPVTTTAYRHEDGYVQPTAGIWARRAYLKRIWTLHRQLPPEKMHPRMTLHMTNTQILPYMVWNDSNLDLEWHYQVLPRQKAFRPDLMRAESLGLQTGNIPQALAKNRKEISHFGTLMVHEIRSWFVNPRARDMLQKMLEFGYGRGARVINYWDEDVPLMVSNDQCKWLLLKRNGKIMVLFCTWNEKAEDLTAKIDTRALEIAPKKAVNVESDEQLNISGGKFSFEMPGYGTRLFRCE